MRMAEGDDNTRLANVCQVLEHERIYTAKNGEENCMSMYAFFKKLKLI